VPWSRRSWSVGCLAALTFVGALHSPAPRDVGLGLVGPQDVVGPVAHRLDQQRPGAFDVHRYASRSEAEGAIRDREIVAAYLPDQAQPELLLASADGGMQALTLQATFEQLSMAAPGPVVQDVVPAAEGDRAGLSPFLLVVSLTIPGLLLAMLLALAGGAGTPSRVRLATAALGAAGVGLVNAAVADLVLDALPGHYWQVASVSALTVLALTAATLALHRLLGLAGLALGPLLFLVVGMPASGAAVGPDHLPAVFRLASLALPPGEAVRALRGVQYFDGAASATSLWLLALWAATGAVVLLAPPSRAPQPAPVGAEPVRVPLGDNRPL